MSTDATETLVGIALTLFMGTLTGLTLYIFVFAPANVTPEISTPTRPEFGTIPPDCVHLHAQGKTCEWSACMLVPCRPLPEMNRDDI